MIWKENLAVYQKSLRAIFQAIFITLIHLDVWKLSFSAYMYMTVYRYDAMSTWMNSTFYHNCF